MNLLSIITLPAVLVGFAHASVHATPHASPHKRCAYLMELDPRYVDVIIDRWEEFTGKKAVKLN